MHTKLENSSRSDSTQALVGISFTDRFRAQEFVVAASGLAASGRLRLKDVVTVEKMASGQTLVHESTDPTPGRAALSGAVWTGLLGLLLGGPVGWVAGLAFGAGAGAVTAKVIDVGIPDEWVRWFREAVQPGTTTAVLLVEDLEPSALLAEASRFTGAKLVHATLDDWTTQQLKSALGDQPASEPIADEGPVIGRV